jgi:serine/threonine-protein kinase HipA
MGLHLVGETLDARRAHRHAQAGELVPLVRGVYADPGDVDATVLDHAVRIARYLYPRAYLSSISAQLLGPTRDGKLYISGARNQRTRLRSLEIVQNEAPDQPSLVNAVVGDDMGEMQVRASSPRQRFLEAFRRRSEHAAAIDMAARREMAKRLVEEYGSAEKAADALHALARENRWFHEAAAAEQYLLTGPPVHETAVNKSALDLIVAWHRKPVGHLIHDGFEWRWRPQADWPGPPLISARTPGRLPPFIESLLPEGWLAEILQARDERETLREGRRYLSNITIAPSEAELRQLPADVRHAALGDFTMRGRFTGSYGGPARETIEHEFERNLARLYASRQMPRLSGVQIKAPMCLRRDGTLVPADGRPFTHILKPAGTADFVALPIVEGLCLALGRKAGFDVPSFAMIDMPGDLPPALVVERFDIRHSAQDRRMIALEDFCSVLELPPSAKYDGTIERMARALRPLSTEPARDTEVLFARALFAWLIADGDMHLKNLALLKFAGPGGRTFRKVHMAPLYDPATTRVFARLAGDRMAFKMNGKDDKLKLRDFLTLARTIDLPVERAERIVGQMTRKLHKAAGELGLPAFVARWEEKHKTTTRDSVLRIVRERTQALLQ